jgi:hypothetical protein
VGTELKVAGGAFVDEMSGMVVGTAQMIGKAPSYLANTPYSQMGSDAIGAVGGYFSNIGNILGGLAANDPKALGQLAAAIVPLPTVGKAVKTTGKVIQSTGKILKKANRKKTRKRNKGKKKKGGIEVQGKGGSGPGAPSASSYATADEAAKAALKEANPTSITANTEYGGLVYKNSDGTYGYTNPARGTGTSFDPSSVSAPSGSQVVGDYHTHGDYSIEGPSGKPIRTSDPAKDAYNSDSFSQSDIGGISSDAKGIPGYSGYLGTPSGDFQKFTPDSGKAPAKF